MSAYSPPGCGCPFCMKPVVNAYEVHVDRSVEWNVQMIRRANPKLTRQHVEDIIKNAFAYKREGGARSIMIPVLDRPAYLTCLTESRPTKLPKVTITINLPKIDFNTGFATMGLMEKVITEATRRLIMKKEREFYEALVFGTSRSTKVPEGILNSRSTSTMAQPTPSILDQADKAVNSTRQAEYGDPLENAVREALVATATTGKPITPVDVVQVMHAKKMVRSGKGHHEDSNVDQAGYSEIRDRVQAAWADGTVQKLVRKILGGWVTFRDTSDVKRLEAQSATIEAYQAEVAALRMRCDHLQADISQANRQLARIKPNPYGDELCRGDMARIETRDRYEFMQDRITADVTTTLIKSKGPTLPTEVKFGKQYAIVEVK